MAVDMFIKIGDLKGESQDQTHKDQIDVITWSWGVSNSGSAHIGGGAGTGKANVQDLSFTKWMDKSSTPLLLACCNGKHFPEASLTVRKAGEKPVEYCKIKLEQVLISSVSTGGSGHDDRYIRSIIHELAVFYFVRLDLTACLFAFLHIFPILLQSGPLIRMSMPAPPIREHQR